MNPQGTKDLWIAKIFFQGEELWGYAPTKAEAFEKLKSKCRLIQKDMAWMWTTKTDIEDQTNSMMGKATTKQLIQNGEYTSLKRPSYPF